MYNVKVANNGGSKFFVKSKNYEFIVDTQGEGVTPPDALLASLGSCIGVYIRKYAVGAKDLELHNFEIIVEADFDRTTPICFRDINVSIDLKGLKLDERRREAFMAFIKNCPIHNTLKNNPNVKISVR